MQRTIYRHGMGRLGATGIEFPGKHGWAMRVAVLSALLLAVSAAPGLAQETAGKDLKLFYRQNCLGCHGADGSAIGIDGKKLRGQDFTDTAWLRDTRDPQMVKAILKGIFFGWAMPGFKDSLTQDEAQRMVTDVIRKSKKGQVIAPNAKGPGDK